MISQYRLEAYATLLADPDRHRLNSLSEQRCGLADLVSQLEAVCYATEALLGWFGYI